MRRAALLAAIAVAALFVSLVVKGAPLRRWILNVLTDRSAAPPAERPAPRPPEGPAPLRLAVSAMISPERTYTSYGELFTDLGRRLGRPVELVQRHTYQEVNQLLVRGEVDLAWICTGAWPELARQRAARLVAVPLVSGRTTYNAVMLVGAGSSARNVADLRGARFAYTDPLSLTGYLHPRRLLTDAGTAPEAFFASTFFTHGHDLSIEAVRRGIADAASVDSLVFDYLVQRSPGEVEGLRVIDRSRPYPIPPLVVPARVPAEDVVTLREALVSFGQDERGRALLHNLQIERFERPDEEAYGRLE